MAYLVAMEMLLPWKQRNFEITQLYESIFGSNLAHTFLCDNMNDLSPQLLRKHCYHGNQKIVQLFSYLEKTLSSYLAHIYSWIKHIAGLTSCYGSVVTMATK